MYFQQSMKCGGQSSIAKMITGVNWNGEVEKNLAAEWGRGMVERVRRFIPERRAKFEEKPEASGSPGPVVGRAAP